MCPKTQRTILDIHQCLISRFRNYIILEIQTKVQQWDRSQSSHKTFNLQSVMHACKICWGNGGRDCCLLQSSSERLPLAADGSGCRDPAQGNCGKGRAKTVGMKGHV